MSRSLGKWKLPQPTDMREDSEWLQIPRIARTIPFGYKQNEEDPEILDPIELLSLIHISEHPRLGMISYDVFF